LTSTFSVVDEIAAQTPFDAYLVSVWILGDDKHLIVVEQWNNVKEQ